MNKECKHTHLKVRKHRGEDACCLHCLEKGCGATWSNPFRALSFLKKFKYITVQSK